MHYAHAHSLEPSSSQTYSSCPSPPKTTFWRSESRSSRRAPTPSPQPRAPAPTSAYCSRRNCGLGKQRGCYRWGQPAERGLSGRGEARFHSSSRHLKQPQLRLWTNSSRYPIEYASPPQTLCLLHPVSCRHHSSACEWQQFFWGDESLHCQGLFWLGLDLLAYSATLRPYSVWISPWNSWRAVGFGKPWRIWGLRFCRVLIHQLLAPWFILRLLFHNFQALSDPSFNK